MNLRKKILKHLLTDVNTRWDQLSEYFKNNPATQDFRQQHKFEELMEMLWQLVAEKLVYISSSDPEPNHWRWVLSERGKRAATSSGYEPDDPDGYIEDLKRDNPKLDKIILLYFEEALKSYNSECFLASSVMLGVASERAFQLLGEAFIEWLPESNEKEKFQKIFEDPHRNYAEKFTEFRKRFDSHINEIPKELSNDIKVALDAILNLFRINRNEAGHPIGKIVGLNKIRRYLTTFAYCLQDIYALRRYFLKSAVTKTS